MKNIFFFLILLIFPANIKVFSKILLGKEQNYKDTININTENEALNKDQAAQIIAAAGFSREIVPLVTCLAEYESHFQPNAVNTNENNSRDYGLLQINSVWLKECKTTAKKLLNPYENSRCALKIYKTQGLTAWTTYKKFKDTCLAYKVNLDNFAQFADSNLNPINQL